MLCVERKKVKKEKKGAALKYLEFVSRVASFYTLAS